MNYHPQQSYWSQQPNSGHYGYPIIVTSSGTPASPHFLPQNQYPQPPPQPQYLCAPVYYYPSATPPPQQQTMTIPSSKRHSHRMSTISTSSSHSNNNSNGSNAMRKSRRPMSVQAPTQQQYRMASIAEEKEIHQQQKRASSALGVTPSDKDEEIPLAMLAYRKGYPTYQRRSTTSTTTTTHHRHLPCNYSATQPSNMSIRSAPATSPRPQSSYRRNVRMETSHSASNRTTSNNSSRRPSLVSDHPYSTATSVTSSSEPSSSYSATTPATPSSVSRRPSIAKRWINRFTRSLKS